jgi:hypothetical protein
MECPQLQPSLAAGPSPIWPAAAASRHPPPISTSSPPVARTPRDPRQGHGSGRSRAPEFCSRAPHSSARRKTRSMRKGPRQERPTAQSPRQAGGFSSAGTLGSASSSPTRSASGEACGPHVPKGGLARVVVSHAAMHVMRLVHAFEPSMRGVQHAPVGAFSGSLLVGASFPLSLRPARATQRPLSLVGQRPG